jgi:hypothetical protein
MLYSEEGQDLYKLEARSVDGSFLGYATHSRAFQDRGEVPDFWMSGDNFNLAVVDPHDPTTMSKTRSTNAIAEPTSDGYQPCWC